MSARLVLLCLDGFPARLVAPDRTPHLARLATEGAWATRGGRAELPSSTYPNHATLLTGATLAGHGVYPTLSDSAQVVPATDRVSAVPTLIDRAAAAGVPACSVVGDFLLVQTLALARAGAPAWPALDVVESLPGSATCEHGYLRDEVVLPVLVEAAGSDADLVFGQLNESDTIGHTLGPDSAEALERYRAVDAAVGSLCEALAERWHETALVIVSDHDMEERTDAPPIELEPVLNGGLVASAPDGGAIWLWVTGDPHEAAEAVEQVEGVERCEVFAGSQLLALACPGRIFAAPLLPERGFHGGASSAATLAIVAGGSPAVPRLAEAMRAGPPLLAGWCGAMAALLGLGDRA